MTPNYRVSLMIPVRDRLGYLKWLLHWAANGETLIKKIVIFDMKSSYPPMVEVLDKLSSAARVGEDGVPVKVYRLPNGGARSLFSAGLANDLLKQEIGPNERFVISDPDVLPELTEKKLLLIMALHKILDHHRHVDKVGCALRIDDLPDHFPQKWKVIDWERRFWKNPIDDCTAPYPGKVYRADVATTFCMIRRLDRVNSQGDGRSLRFAALGMARHLPWYENPSNLSPDLQWYYKNAPMRKWGHPGPGVSWSPFEDPNR